jgi:serine/threonine protein kinase
MVLNNGVDQAADIWALGVIAYEMVMYATPFADSDGIKVFSNIANAAVSIDLLDTFYNIFYLF